MRFTQEQIDQAKQVPVERIAKSVGYTVVKKGRYFSLEEMDSLMINTRKNLWWRYSNGTHGNSIDFLVSKIICVLDEEKKIIIGYHSIFY